MGASRASLTSSGGPPQAAVEVDLIPPGGPYVENILRDTSNLIVGVLRFRSLVHVDLHRGRANCRKHPLRYKSSKNRAAPGLIGDHANTAINHLILFFLLSTFIYGLRYESIFSSVSQSTLVCALLTVQCFVRFLMCSNLDYPVT